MEKSNSKITNKLMKTSDLIAVVRSMGDGQDSDSSDPVYSSIVMNAVLGHLKEVQKQLEKCELTMQMITGSDSELCQQTLRQNQVDRGEV